MHKSITPNISPLSTPKELFPLNRYIALLLLLLATSAAHAQNIEVSFTSIKSTRGQIIVKVFADDKGFEDDRPLKTLKFPKQGIANGQMTAKITLEPGTYGLALLDDENSTGIMEYNMIGMPKEGFGFSNFYLTGMKKPKFEQFKFSLGHNQSKNITMKIRYL